MNSVDCSQNVMFVEKSRKLNTILASLTAIRKLNRNRMYFTRVVPQPKAILKQVYVCWCWLYPKLCCLNPLEDDGIPL